MRCLICFLTLCLVSFSIKADQGKNLELLWADEDYQEWLKQVWQTPLEKRSKDWNKRLGQAAEQVAISFTQNSLFTASNTLYLKQLRAKNSLKDQEFFLQAVDDYLLGFLKNQWELKVSEEEIAQTFKSLWREKGQNIKLADKVLLLFSEITPHPLVKKYGPEVIAYIGSHELGEFYCQKPSFLKLWKISNQKPLLELRLMPLKQHLLKTLGPDCLKAMAKSLDAKELDIDKLKLRALFAPKGEDYEFALLHYLLKYPFPGDLFNIAANQLEALAQKASSREKILGQLNNLPTFPEGFMRSELAHQEDLLVALRGSYPELLPSYASKCLNYLKSRKANLSNPTPFCLQALQRNILDGHLSSYTLKKLKAAAFLP